MHLRNAASGQRLVMTWCNPALLSAFTVSSGDTIEHLVSRVLPEALCDEITDHLQNSDPAKRVLENAILQKADDGTVRTFDLELLRIKADTPGEHFGYCRLIDGTERQIAKDTLRSALVEAEVTKTRFEHAMETIPAGFAMYDRDDILVAFNSKYTELYNISAPAIQIGAKFEEIIRYGLENGQYPEAEDNAEEWFAERLDRENRKRAPVARQLPDGRVLRVHEVENSNGDLVGLRSDVTEYYKQQQKLEEQAEALRQANDAVQAASLAKERFFAKMSHEIRTPMNGILGMTEMLSETSLDPQQAAFAQTIMNSATSLLNIVNDILDFSKSNEDKLVLAQEPFSLKDLVYELSLLVQPMAHAKGLEVWVDYPGSVPDRFLGDSQRVRQILMNHLSNAVKFTAQGHVGVRVRYHQDGSAAPLSIVVEDSGKGIPHHLHETVFAAYEQTEETVAGKIEGTGLGLAISKALVSQMGGHIQLESEPGAGARFNITLALPPCSESTPEAACAAPSGRVAIVGGQEHSRTILKGLLAEQNREAVFYNSLQDVAWDEQGSLLAVIVDLDLRTGDAASDFSDPPAALNNSTPVILLSATPGAVQADESPFPSGTPILLKPVRSEELTEALGAVVSASSAAVEPSEAPPSTIQSEGDFEKLKILVVDDNKTNRLVAEKMLSPTHAKIAFASDGLEAIARYRQFAPDVIFMDVSMPVLDGLEATRRIRKIEHSRPEPRCAIVALTAHVDDAQRQECETAGFDDLVGKPVRRKALVDVIKRLSPPV